MKCLSKVLLYAALILLNGAGFSQSIDSLYEVGTWQGFRSAAVSFTFDDNCSNQIAVALPMFDAHNFKMTFYTVINWSPNWTVLQSAVANGHEVSSHTLSHVDLSTIDSTQQISELRDSRDQINNHISGNQCLTLAYPYCNAGNRALCEEYYLAARICSGAIERKTPLDFMNISSIICGELGLVKSVQDFKNKFNSAASSKGWSVFLIHGIDNDGGYSPTQSANLSGALDYLDVNNDKFWVSTFSNVVRYIRERNCVSIEELSFEDSIITVSVTDTLDNLTYDYPVTIRRQLPEDWSSVTVNQNGVTLSSDVVNIDSDNYIVFDVIPDNGQVLIINNETTDVSKDSGTKILTPYLEQNYPNPFNPVTTIGYELPYESEIDLSVYNLLGQKIKTLISKKQSSGSYNVGWDATGYNSGIYFYQLKTNTGFVQTEKLVLLK